MKFGYLNAWSVKEKTTDVVNFIAEFKLEVLCITETWLRSDGGDESVCVDMTPPGYKMVQSPRTTGRGGGVAVLYNAAFKSKRQKTTKYTSFDLVEVLLWTKKDCIRCCTLYRPPGGNHSQPVSVFLNEFEQYMDSHATSTG